MAKDNSTPIPSQLPLPIEGVTITFSLKQGYKCIVDATDADLTLLKWYPAIKKDKVYVWRKTPIVPMNEKKTIHLHRQIMERVLNRELLRTELVDHWNNNPLDNRRCNLRLASKITNAQNSKLSSRNTSGYKGVYRSFKKWAAEIKVNKQKIRLGRFDTPEEAYQAYCEAALKYHGEFARLK